MENEFYKELAKNTKWGYLREDTSSALKAGKNENTYLHRTGLPQYLAVIFPNTTDWIHDEIIPNSGRKFRPDYRSESLKLIIEFDGLPHYTSPKNISADAEKTKFYTELGYRVVRIPYFIQLTNTAIKKLFNVEVNEPMFIEDFPSLDPFDGSSPANLCIAGINRMAEEFVDFPEQFEINIKYLKTFNNEFYTAANFLEKLYNEKVLLINKEA